MRLDLSKFIKTFLLLLSAITYVKADAIKLSTIEKSKILGNHEFDVLEDTAQNFNINDVINSRQKEDWRKLHYFENLRSTYWIRYTIINDHPTNNKWVIELLDPHIDELTFYWQDSTVSNTQGFKHPFNQRIYKHKNHVFDAEIPLGDTGIFYLKINSLSHIAFTTKIQTNRLFSNYSLNEYYFLGIFYGFLAIMVLYNLILFLFTGMRTRVYYLIYVISSALNSFTEDGIGFQYLWPSYPGFNRILADYEPLIYLGSFIMYAISFLDIAKSKFKTILISYLAVFFAGYTILRVFDLIPNYWLLFYIVPFFLILYYCIDQYIKKNHNTRFLIIGTLLIFVSFFILFLRMQGKVDNSPFVVYFFNFAVTIEIIMFSMAIGDKLKFRQEENLRNKELVIQGLKRNEELKDKVNRELEQKVSERTHDLNEAKELLEKQAKEITQMNLQLDLQNRDLTKKVVEVSKKRIHSEDLDPHEFHELYPNKLKCFELLEEIKWQSGFICRKCEHSTFNQGSSFRSRRCTKCGTTETPTAHTIFHGTRIPIEKAFYIFALVVQRKGDITSSELEKKTGVGQKSCWTLKQKILAKIKDKGDTYNSWNELIF